jgi:hypothetical protein
VVGRLEVVGCPRQHDAVVVGVFDRAEHRGSLAEGGGGDVDHLGSRVDREHDRLGHAVGSVDRLVAHLHAHEAASRAHAGAAEFVVGLGSESLGLAVGVVIDGVVGLGVVGVAVEVPARDVVRIAVLVVVKAPVRRASCGPDFVVDDLAVPEGDDQVLGRDAAGLRIGAPDARILFILVDADHAVFVRVIAAERFAFGVLGIRQLARVQIALFAQVLRVAELPVHAALHIRDGDVAHAIARPRPIDAHARGPFRVARFGRRLRDAVEQRPLLGIPGFRGREVALGVGEARVVGAADGFVTGFRRRGMRRRERAQQREPKHPYRVGRP